MSTNTAVIGRRSSSAWAACGPVAVAGAGAGAGGGGAAAASDDPQPMQNCATPGFSVAQLGQIRANGCPAREAELRDLGILGCAGCTNRHRTSVGGRAGSSAVGARRWLSPWP